MSELNHHQLNLEITKSALFRAYEVLSNAIVEVATILDGLDAFSVSTEFLEMKERKE